MSSVDSPVGQSVVDFSYCRSEALRKRMLVEQGRDPGKVAVSSIDLRTQPRDLRAKLVEALGLPHQGPAPDRTLYYDLRWPLTVIGEDGLTHVQNEVDFVLDAALLSLEQLVPLFEHWLAVRASLAEADAEYAAREAARERERASRAG